MQDNNGTIYRTIEVYNALIKEYQRDDIQRVVLRVEAEGVKRWCGG